MFLSGLTFCALAASFGCGDTSAATDRDDEAVVDRAQVAGAADAGATPPVSRPGTFKLFDKIPQFGMYARASPRTTSRRPAY